MQWEAPVASYALQRTRLDGCIHQHRIKTLKQMIGPGRNHQTRIRSGLEEGRWKGFLEPARQEKQWRGMVAQDRRVTNGNEKPGSNTPFSHCLASRKATHRLTCKNIYRPDLACD